MNIYDRIFGEHYKQTTGIPIVIGIICIFIIFNPLTQTLNLKLGMDFAGGSEVTLYTANDITADGIKDALSVCAKDLKVSSQKISGKTNVIIKSTETLDEECVRSSLQPLLGDEAGKITPTVFKPELGRSLVESGRNVLIISMILMTIVVFIAFRSFVPAMAVILSAVFDMIVPAAIMTMLSMELTLAGLAALLMLIGYSVDTDIMLTARVLKQRGGETINEIFHNAFITGMTMTGTTIGAMTVVVVITNFVHLGTLSEIATILLFGLVADLANTWIMNAGILKWYVLTKKTGKRGMFKFSLFRT